MTVSERRLAMCVALAWVFANVLVSAINVALRLMAHRQVFLVDATIGEWAAVLQALAGVVLVIDISHSERFRMGRFIGLSVILYTGFEAVRQFVWRAAGGHPTLRSALLRAAIDMQHLFILVVGAAGATLMVRWHERAVASAEQRGAAEAALAEANVRTLRTQIQPELIRNALLEIETVLQRDGVAAETALLNLSDFLRIALLRARGESWNEQLELEYDRLSRAVGGGAA